MGSSAKKKKEKKKDFQKPKLKVGKAAPKAANSTNTSFKAKSILINQRITANTPSSEEQILHHVSLLSSRTDSQRKESLAYLSATVAAIHSTVDLPISMKDLLIKIMPLLLDSSSGVRSEYLKLFQTLPDQAVCDNVDLILPFIRAGMTHLSAEIRRVALDTLSHALRVSGNDLVSAPGGWTKTLQCFETNLGFKDFPTGDGWSVHKSGFKEDSRSVARTMQVAEKFLSAGLQDNVLSTELSRDPARDFPIYGLEHHEIPINSNPYSHLDLFEKPLDDDRRRIDDRSERIFEFNQKFYPKFAKSLERGKTEGGDIGRSAGQMLKLIMIACVET